jgi:CheY-like chemotaxis protein
MSKPIIILLADDDLEDQDILEEYLVKQNGNTVCYRAINGKEAIEMISGNKMPSPDLMVFDYKMPLMGAIDVLKYLKEKQILKMTPKVVWSTSGQSSHQQICIENGAVAYFVKPDSPGGLTILAKNLFNLIS